MEFTIFECVDLLARIDIGEAEAADFESKLSIAAPVALRHFVNCLMKLPEIWAGSVNLKSTVAAMASYDADIKGMARLIVSPGTAQAREVVLKVGVNSIGRAPANDVTIEDGSVSGSHCQLIVSDDTVRLR